MALAKAALVLALGIGAGEWDARITAHYSEKAMPRVLSVRDRKHQQGLGPWIPRSSCYIAHPTLPLATWVQVWGQNTGKVRRCVVADTSQPWDRARHVRTRLIEIDWANTMAICGSTALPNRRCASLVRRLRQ